MNKICPRFFCAYYFLKIWTKQQNQIKIKSLLKGADVKLKNKMKKIIVMLVALIGFGISTYARDGVTPNAPAHLKTKDVVQVDFRNSNNQSVHVTFVIVYRGEVVSNEQHATLFPNAGRSQGSGNFSPMRVSHWAGGKQDFNPNHLDVRITDVRRQ